MLLSYALQWTQGKLQKRYAERSSREAYAILLSLERFNTMSQIIMELDRVKLKSDEVELIQNWAERRAKGEPLAYLRGYEYHYGRKFEIDKNVLIPRPETELIIQRCVQIYKADTTIKPLRGLDIGTGSGILPVNLKLELPNSDWLATDIDINCLMVAKRNSRQHNADVKFLQSHCARGLKGRFDLIVSNPPYIKFGDPLVQEEVHQYEPHIALYAEQDGLSLIYEILSSMLELLTFNGRGLIEVGYNQQQKIDSKVSNMKNIRISWIKDFAGIPRIMELKKDVTD